DGRRADVLSPGQQARAAPPPERRGVGVRPERRRHQDRRRPGVRDAARRRLLLPAERLPRAPQRLGRAARLDLGLLRRGVARGGRISHPRRRRGRGASDRLAFLPVYTPAHFAVDAAEAKAFLSEIEAADLVTVTEKGLVATFLPLVFVPEPGPAGALIGHVA